MQYIWIDVETGGLNEWKQDVTQVACIPLVDGKLQDAFNEHCQPLDYSTVQQEALNITGMTIAKLREFQEAPEMWANFLAHLKPFKCKFRIAGYNVNFDKKFIGAAFSKNGLSSEYSSLFDVEVHDTYRLAKDAKKKGLLKTKNLKLGTLCEHFGIEIDAHDALSDIRATIALDKELKDLLGIIDVVETRHIDPDIEIKTIFKEPCQLRAHSKFSIGEAIPAPKELLHWCLKNNIPGVAITDKSTAISLFDIARFRDYIVEYNEANDTDHASDACIGVPGVELYVKDDTQRGYHSITLWATSNKGYYNVMKLSSLAYNTTIEISGVTKPITTYAQISQYSDGLLFGTAGIDGLMGFHIVNGDTLAAKDAFDYYVETFGDALRVELHANDATHTFNDTTGQHQPNQPTNQSPNGNHMSVLNGFMLDMATQNGIKIVPISDMYFIDPNDKPLQDVLMKNNGDNGWFFHESHHAKTANTMFKKLKAHLGDKLSESMFEEWIDNSHEIANEAKNIHITNEFTLPEIEIPQHIKDKTTDYNTQTFLLLTEKVKEHGRWVDTDEYKDRFKKEIDVIMKNKALNFIPYFLLYEDIGTYTRSQGVLQNIARGSAGGALVSYYLKIIHVDPIAADLPFERFLSHARINAGSFPDIDMDIGDSARPLVIRYLKDKYGLGFAQVSTHLTTKTKNAIKDAMWAFHGRNRNDPEIKQLCASIPDSPQGTSENKFLYGYVDKEGHHHQGELERNEKLTAFFNRYPDVASMTKRLLGVTRNLSRHASAFVVSTLDLSHQRSPVMLMADKDPRVGMIQVTQYNATMCEKEGLVKADILGLSTLTAVSECLDLVSDREDIDYRAEDDFGMPLIYRLPEDKGVYRDFYNKKTDSSFQFNSSLIKGFVQKFNPTKRSHLKDMTALCRPGALDAPMLDTTAAMFYMDVRNGKRKVEYLHPDLEPILKTTNGVITYQEQLMKILVDFGNHSLEDADIIRAAIAKKKVDVMMKAFDKIRTGTMARGWTKEQANTLCEQMIAFARYSFNLSHSHAYSELGYITMYLKHHHPLEWWCAMLNLHISKEDKMRADVSLLGDLVKSPSLLNPSARFKIVDDSLYAPISVVKAVGAKVVEELTSHDHFDSLQHFCSIVDHRKVNIGAIAALIKARAMDCFMDQDLLKEDYGQARLKLMEQYVSIRKHKKGFNPELHQINPIDLFLQEKSVNKVFNKALLSDATVISELSKFWPKLRQTHKDAVPMMDNQIPILRDVSVAEGLIEKEYEGTVGLVLLFEHSLFKKGVSKKSGRAWSNTSTTLSDGYATLESTDWNAVKPLRLAENTVVYVSGTLKKGWKTPVSINVTSITPLERGKDD